MSTTPAQPPAPQKSPAARVRSFIGWAFVLSVVIHLIAAPFLRIKAQEEQKADKQIVEIRKKTINKPPPTPPPTPKPTPTPPPPKKTPPPVKATNPPPLVKKLVVHPPKTTAKSPTGPTQPKYVVPPKGDENGNPNGNAATGAPAPTAGPATTSKPAPTLAPTPIPTPTPTPKPACANPNAPAAIKGTAAELEYPEIAREQGAVGTAIVKVTLSAGGSIQAATIQKSAGNAALDQAAIKSAKQTAYIAETVNCVPTAGSYLYQADFTGQ